MKRYHEEGKTTMKNMAKIMIPLLIIVATVLWFNWEKFFPPSPTAITSVDKNSTKSIAIIKIPDFYNQQDKRWKNIPLGKTNETLGKVGCLVSSVAMNLSYLNIVKTPKEINHELTEIEGYTQRGWLIWDKLREITADEVVVKFPMLSHESMDTYLEQGQPVLAKVFIHRVIPHWVLVVGKEKGEYLMLDPLTKGEATKLSSYGSYLYSIRVLEKL